MNKVFKPNEDQEKALLFSDNLCVLAGAGSGKTGTLTEFLIRLLAGELQSIPEKIKVTEILALTFANKAAAEMRQRLREEILKRFKNDNKNSSWWFRAYKELDRADISTIHSFAFKIIRSKALWAGLNPEIRPQSDKFLLDKDVADLLVDHLDEKQVLDLLAFLQIEGGLYKSGLLQWLNKFLNWQSTYGELASVEKINISFGSELDSLRSATFQLATLINNGVFDTDKAYFSKILLFYNFIQDAMDKINASFEDNATLFQQALSWQKKLKTSGNWYVKEGRSLKKEFTLHIDSLVGKYHSIICQPLKENLLFVGQKIYEKLQSKMINNAEISFNDILIKTREILAKNPYLRAEISSEYKVILLDEFQDTNRLQADIIAYLSAPFEDTRVFPENYQAWKNLSRQKNKLIIFGDPKQSIYRFRGAEVNLMSEQPVEGGNSLQLVPLRKNYRSQAGLIDFFNNFFPQYLGENFFTEKDLQIAVRPKHYQEPQAIYLQWSVEEKINADLKRVLESLHLAHYLRDLLDGKKDVFINDSQERPKASDIAILFRTFTNVDIYAEALKKYKIPFKIVKGWGIFQVLPVRALICAFAFLADLNKEINLLAVLRSPLAGVSDEAICSLAWHKKQDFLISDFFASQDVIWPKLNEDDLGALDNLRIILIELKELIYQLPAIEIFNRLLKKTNLIAVCGAQTGGDAQVDALNRFINFVSKLPLDILLSPLTTADYLLKKIKLKDEKEEESLASSEDAITLMTIHQSKGLEFGVVAIPQVDDNFFVEKDSIIFDDLKGTFALSVKDPVNHQDIKPPDFNLLKEQENLALQNDAQRILYVAATRARDHLIFAGPKLEKTNDFEKKWSYNLALFAENKPDLLKTVSIDISEADFSKKSEKSLKIEPDLSFKEAYLSFPTLSFQAEYFELSVTDLALALSCFRAYYFKKILKVTDLIKIPLKKQENSLKKQEIKNKKLNTSQRGNLFHLSLKLWEPKTLLNAELGLKLVKKAATALSFELTTEELNFVSFKVLEFSKSKWGKELSDASKNGFVIERECSLWLDIEVLPYTFILSGVLDLFYLTGPNKGQLLDYKLAERGETDIYGRQLQIYALALKKAFNGLEIEGGLYFAAENPAFYQEIKLDYPDFEDELLQLGNFLLDINSQKFPQAPKLLQECPDKWCAYKNICSTI